MTAKNVIDAVRVLLPDTDQNAYKWSQQELCILLNMVQQDIINMRPEALLTSAGLITNADGVYTITEATENNIGTTNTVVSIRWKSAFVDGILARAFEMEGTGRFNAVRAKHHFERFLVEIKL